MSLKSDHRFQEACTRVVDALRTVVEAVERVDVPTASGAGGKRGRGRSKAAPDLSTLDEIERSIRGYLVAHRALLDLVAPRRDGRRRWGLTAPVEDRGLVLPFLRVAIAVSDIVQLATVPVRRTLGTAWGTHLFNRDDVALAEFAPLDLRGLSMRAVRILLPEVTADLVDALRDIVTDGGVWLTPDLDLVRDGLDRACLHLVQRHIGESLWLGPDQLWTAAEIGLELGLDEAQVEAKADQRHLIRLRTWDGRERYPRFQTLAGRVDPLVDELLPSIVAGFTSWALAFWLKSRIDAGIDIGVVREQLRELNAWRPDREGPADRYAGVPPAQLETWQVSGTYHRVARRGNEPFYFASVDTALPPRPQHTAPADGGRWDLPVRTKTGTMYLAERPEGAWAETLDRLPIVTLSDVLGRTMWELTAKGKPISVVDLTGPRIPTEIWTEVRRARTQTIAARALSRGVSGMRVRLRSSPIGLGLALFGPHEATPPSVARLGHWRIESRAAELDDALWKYIEARPKARDLATYLRRFPGEVSLVE